jgi:PPP family 3-phenylpropionic acid transporter
MGPGDLRFAGGYFFLFAIYGVASPFLQVLLRGLGYGSLEVGLYQGLFEAVGIGGPLVLGRLADKSGSYRPLLLLTALMSATAALPLALIRSPLVTLPLIAALALGIRGLVPIMDASVVAHTTKARGAATGPRKGYGVLRSVGTMGFIAMLFITQAVHLESATPLTIGLWIMGSALVFALTLVFLPESGHGAKPDSAAAPRGKTALDPVLLLGLLIIALGRLAMAPINAFLTLYATEALHSDAASLLWALAATAEVPALMIAGRLVDRIGSMRVIALATLAIALRLGIYALVPTLAGAVAAQLLHFFCYGLFLPAAVSFVSSRVPPERRAWGMAVFTGLGMGLPSFLGATIGGFVLERSGYAALFGWATLPALLGLAIYALTRRRFRA